MKVVETLDQPSPTQDYAKVLESPIPPTSLSLELLHKTQVEGVPVALCQFQGRLLAGIGSTLRLYDLGKKRLLKKCENKLFPNTIISIQAYRDCIYVGDIQESFHFCKYRRDENQLY
ncbi:unnamed protein product [Linum tenue]|uniref:RSE1/DDB1/CPSF1 C-terminal domain-containing protein n=1 Tax=Linum tenue TaxID=586396 RepID=A0AAV0M914_9ROSI|nr:unnamed protein product [Linum tenue]